MIEIGKKNLLYGGRNSGKTYETISFIIDRAISNNENSIIFRYSATYNRHLLESVKKRLEKIGIDFDYVCNNLKKEITFKNGVTIYFDFLEGMREELFVTPNKIYKNVFIEEAEQIPVHQLHEAIKSLQYDTLIACVNKFPIEFEDEFFSMFDVKKRRTIEDNRFATVLDYKLLDIVCDIDVKEYLNVRFGLTEKEIYNIIKNLK